MKVGMRIKNRRIELGLSVDEVANRLGKNRATVYRYESNEIENLPITVLEPLAEILQTTPALLMGWGSEENPIIARLHELMLSKHLSEDKFAMRMGYTTEDIFSLEYGRKEVTQEFIKKVCHEFNVSVDWLQYGIGSLYMQDSLLTQVAEKYDLNEFEQIVINKYLTFNGRSGITQFLQSISRSEEDLLNEINEQAATCDIPLLGKTAAGNPLGYGDVSHETIGVKTIPKGAEFTLLVTGDSMEPVIKEGSIVFVKPQPVAENGEIVIAEVDGEVTCKKFYQDEYGDIELHSINPQYEPIIEFENLRIIGKVLL